MQDSGAYFWDKFAFSYQVSGSDTELQLPFRLLVLGAFSGRPDSSSGRVPEPLSIDAASFDRVLAAFDIRLSIEIFQDLDEQGPGFEILDIPLNGLADFEPQRLIGNVPYLAMHIGLIRMLQQQDKPLQVTDLSVAEQQLLRRSGVQLECIEPEESEFVCMDVNEHLHRLLDSILHDERFQRLEALWRGVWLLCQSAACQDNCQVDVLDLSKDAMADDFIANRDVRDSLLFDIVYFQEFAQYGGHPYSAIVADYEFAAGAEDIQLLRSLGQIGYAAHVPFIAGVSPGFFGKQDFSELAAGQELAELLGGPKYIKWRNLQQEGWANYLALTLPRVRLRNPYRYGAGQIGLIPYHEDTRLQASKSLLGNAALGFAQCLLRSFGELGICTRICGSQGGRIEMTGLASSDSVVSPVETRFSDRRLAELGHRGFTPVTMNPVSGQMYFPGACSLRWGGLHQPGWQLDEGLLDAQVEAQLPYLFVISRIAHYLKVVQRESLGSLQSRSELESELNRWLRRYVSDVDNPSPGIRMRKPLRQAQLRVVEDEHGGGLQMQLAVTPHMKFQGQDFTLSLNLLAE
jgi:type VI secretion system protein ImpC